jgi:uncharacterized delta-60 repeat protein
MDPAFGDHGRILLRDAELGELRGVDVFTEPGSGKLLVVGADSYTKPNSLLRFNSDGSPDLSYGDQGIVRLELGDDSLQIADAELLSDGKWLVAGVMNSYGDEDRIIRGSALLARYLADGMLDASFGNAGRVTLDFGGVYESFGEILLRADGRIVVFGVTDEVGSYDTPRIRPLLAGYTADGERDSGFGNPATPGVSVLNVDAFDEHLYTVVQSADGKLLACGNATRSNGSSKESGAMVARYHSNGMPDNTFGENGAAFFGAYLEAIRTDNCLALADGHLALAGHQGKGEALRGIVLRLAPDGQLDAGFGDDGAVILPTARNSAVSKMLVLSDGALAIAGSHWVPTDNGWFKWSDLLIARLDPATGELDQGFGNDGPWVPGSKTCLPFSMQ